MYYWTECTYFCCNLGHRRRDVNVPGPTYVDVVVGGLELNFSVVVPVTAEVR